MKKVVKSNFKFDIMKFNNNVKFFCVISLIDIADMFSKTFKM